ncbi:MULTISPECIES: hypothetical protein [unclassified Labrenzia]|uniref:hypothetical protein n=1 Tax=unclassified Labrenzia TaxID=2648686 RepID=UPI00126978CA|nr:MULTISPECIES: hypothetical protein [unclassified Labrenzia]
MPEAIIFASVRKLLEAILVTNVFAFRTSKHPEIADPTSPGVLACFVNSPPYSIPIVQIEKAFANHFGVTVPAPPHGMFKVLSLAERATVNAYELQSLVRTDEYLAVRFPPLFGDQNGV